MTKESSIKNDFKQRNCGDEDDGEAEPRLRRSTSYKSLPGLKSVHPGMKSPEKMSK